MAPRKNNESIRSAILAGLRQFTFKSKEYEVEFMSQHQRDFWRINLVSPFNGSSILVFEAVSLPDVLELLLGPTSS